MPQRPTLQTPMPVLLGTTRSCRIDSLEAFATLLQGSHQVLDLEALSPRAQAKAALQLEAANLAFGEIAITSIWGSALTLAVEPLEPCCMLALPAIGWGRYHLEAEAIDNTFGETVAFLPARGWRLINDRTGGTGLHFSDQALLTRVLAINGGTPVRSFAARVSQPLVIRTGERRNRLHIMQLLHGLAMVDATVRLGGDQPHPMLQLDDLILRCIALLLFPELSRPEAMGLQEKHAKDLAGEVQRLMEWIRGNLHRPLSLTEIEQRSPYGRRAIQMGFRQEVGCGPMQWLRQQRLEAAHHHLVNARGKLSVSQVARACGYLNLSAFSRDFRLRFGIPPRLLLHASLSPPQDDG